MGVTGPQQNRISPIAALFYAPLLHGLLRADLIGPIFKGFIGLVVDALGNEEDEQHEDDPSKNYRTHSTVTAVP